MKPKCDLCDRPATYHSVKIVKGQKIEENLCDLHAAQAGMALKAIHTPINELLSNFVKLHSGGGQAAVTEATCGHCGLGFHEFRENSLLGCPDCYGAFEEMLGPLIERAHEGATHHVGKVPMRAGVDEQRQMKLMSLRKRLADAVALEDYELAATLRDEIKKIEEPAP